MYAHLNRPKVQIDRLSNSALESGDFLESIIWDKDSDYKDFSQLILDMNDPGMMLEVRNEGDGDEGEFLHNDLLLLQKLSSYLL